jgi:beta-barrel assembly-enhancing protease
MAMGKSVCALTIVAIVSLLCACASVSPLVSIGQGELEKDEIRIWNRSIEAARRLDESGQLYKDDQLVDYVNAVVQKLIPEELRQRKDLAVKVRIIRNPLLNAFAMSHGAIYLHTGILAKIDNEAQLATLLAHELTHITHRHPVQHFRTIQNLSTAVAVFQLATLAGGQYGSLAGLAGALGATASLSGYSRAMEAEADVIGLRQTIQAGYDPSESPTLFDYLQKDLHDRKIDEPFFFGSHPKLQDRKENYAALIKKYFAGKTGQSGKGQYEEVIGPLLLANAEMDLAMGRWEWAEAATRRSVTIRPDDPRGYYHLGELFRRRAAPGDIEKAESHYQRAVDLDKSYASPYRGLGLVYLKQGNRAKARAAFQNYLTLAPHGEDRAYVDQYLLNLMTERVGNENR